MANNENLIRLSPSEAREYGRRGGKASGKARRKKADFRKTLNALLTTPIDSPEWTPILEALGLDSTLESAVNMAMIREALAGNVKAYEAIARFSGQTERTEADLEEQRVRTAAAKAKAGPAEEEDEEQDDGFLEALKGTASEDWSDEDIQEEEETEETDEEDEEADVSL